MSKNGSRRRKIQNPRKLAEKLYHFCITYSTQEELLRQLFAIIANITLTSVNYMPFSIRCSIMLNADCKGIKPNQQNIFSREEFTQI
jgi:hypothetical protein